MAGYSGFSKSNNAILAEQAGLMTASEFGKRLGISARAIAHTFRPAEWHHTSSWYNLTDYYDPAIVELYGLREAIARVKSARAWDQQQRSCKEIRYGTATVEYWVGSRRHPKREEVKVFGTFKLTGNWWTLPDGSRKRRDKVKFSENALTIQPMEVRP